MNQVNQTFITQHFSTGKYNFAGFEIFRHRGNVHFFNILKKTKTWPSIANLDAALYSISQLKKSD